MPTVPKYTLADLRAIRTGGAKLGMLTCYDYSTARLMEESGVRGLLVGDSAANVILGFDTTLPIELDFLIVLTAAVRRGAPSAFLVADMPFGSYHQSRAQAVQNVTRMVQLSGCDCVKMEVSAAQGKLVNVLADAGVAVMAHLGLRPQSVKVLGGYKTQARSASGAAKLIELARQMQDCGAAALLLEAVPAEVGRAVVEAVEVPVIGCGAGPAMHGHVFVTHDALGFSARAPKFVPVLGDVASMMKKCFADYMKLVESGEYPQPNQTYEMNAGESAAGLVSEPF